ncbi:hypothetical protein [Kiloniella sp.]|uniref:hypothetical protein n=1 Tax=Kiloniella sp. TaxID=1938587 RepID=UPI003A913C37
MGEHISLGQIATVIIAGLIALLSAKYTADRALKKFRSEKWWVKKVEAYTDILEALHHEKAITYEFLESIKNKREVNEELEDKLRENAIHAREQLSLFIDIGGFYISDEALKHLKAHKTNITTIQKEQDEMIALSKELSAIGKCIEKMIELAKSDLKSEE